MRTNGHGKWIPSCIADKNMKLHFLSKWTQNPFYPVLVQRGTKAHLALFDRA